MGWDIYGLCECGFYQRAPFGELFHIHMTICPSCGRDKYSWSLVIGRPVRQGGFFRGKTVLEVKEDR